mgnify:CR=1 FL=1
MKAFLVDDEFLQRKLVKKSVDWQSIGIELCGEAEDGEEALEKIFMLKPDILIMDINIPYVNGIEVSKKVKKVFPETQVIILSAYGEFEYAKKAIQYGVSEYLLKPVTAMELTGVIEKMKKKGFIIGGICLAAIVGILGYNHEAVRVVFHNVYSPSVKLDDSSKWNGGKAYEKLPYSETSENDYLDLYVPDSEEPMPLIILVHGGGFVYNDSQSRQAQLMYRYFRDHGYACASVNYRLAQEAAFPAGVEDVKSAIRFLRANAEKYGYDPERFAIWGESAGGYLSVICGASNDEEFNSVPFIGEDKNHPVSSEVQVILDYYGCMEFGTMEDDYRELRIPKIVRWAASLWLQGAIKDTGYEDVESYWMRKDVKTLTEDEKNNYSPLYYIEKNLTEKNSPDILIWHGDADLDVPYLQSERLNALLTRIVGTDKVEFKLFHNYKHAADQLYSDENLGILKEYLDEKFA